MALNQELGIRAKVEPEMDRSAKRKLTSDVEEAIGDGEQIGGGLRSSTSPSGGGGGGGAGAAAGGGLLARGGGVGGAAKMLGTVALGGVVAAGMLKALETASGRLSGVLSIFSSMSKLFLKPFGDKLAEALLPFAEAGLDMAKNFNEIYQDEGLLVAVGSLAKDAAETIATGIGSAIADILTGKGSTGDFITVGLAGITAAKLAGLLPSIGIGSILSGMGGGSALAGLLGTVSIGSILLGLGVAGVSLAALLGTVKLYELIADTGVTVIDTTIELSEKATESLANEFKDPLQEATDDVTSGLGAVDIDKATDEAAEDVFRERIKNDPDLTYVPPDEDGSDGTGGSGSSDNMTTEELRRLRRQFENTDFGGGTIVLDGKRMRDALDDQADDFFNLLG